MKATWCKKNINQICTCMYDICVVEREREREFYCVVEREGTRLFAESVRSPE